MHEERNGKGFRSTQRQLTIWTYKHLQTLHTSNEQDHEDQQAQSIESTNKLEGGCGDNE